MIIAIDRPSGAGKGTVARRVAEALGLRHVDTGAMYRAVAWLVLHEGLALEDETALQDLARFARFELTPSRVVVGEHDVTTAIRTPRIDRAAAVVARLPRVRAALVERQRALVVAGGVVMEGRDVGTVVLPHADLKVYLDAEPSERARRRARDHEAGSDEAAAAVATALEERDTSDRTRRTSPLVRASDAVLIDTTDLSVDEVVARVLTLARGLPSPTD